MLVDYLDLTNNVYCLKFAAVMIRFNQTQYDVNEGDGTAMVCMEIIAGSAPSPAITIDIDTSNIAAVGKFVLLYY